MCWRMVYTRILRYLPWSGTMPHTEITANLDWKHVAYVRNMYDVQTNGDRAIFDCDLVCYGLLLFPG